MNTEIGEAYTNIYADRIVFIWFSILESGAYRSVQGLPACTGRDRHLVHFCTLYRLKELNHTELYQMGDQPDTNTKKLGFIQGKAGHALVAH